MIIPEKIKKDISKSLNRKGDDGNSVNHNLNDIFDRADSGGSSSYIKDYSSLISSSNSFLTPLKNLMIWYKNDFMRWVDKNPLCDNCGQHLSLEYIPGNTWQMRGIENYYCSFCNSIFSFPRYGKIKEIADNRMGRCSEWAFLFGAILNSLSIKTRIVHDFLDHCWNESFIGGRWIHIDSTLTYPISFDHSYYYEKNWNKEYVFVLAFSKSSLEDVTASYTTKLNQVLDRRSKLHRIQFDKLKDFYEKKIFSSMS
jgi:peptide-N4-(N-acetyl-beta-glucosaminyl)asparagine amidase